MSNRRQVVRLRRIKSEPTLNLASIWDMVIKMNDKHSNRLNDVFSQLEQFEIQLERAVEDGEIDVHSKWDLLARKQEDLLIHKFENRRQSHSSRYRIAA